MARSTSRFRLRMGLCLPEVLISCLIALAGIMCILSSFLSGRLASTGAKHWTQAMNLAAARIERLKSIRYADLSLMPAVTTEANVSLDDRGDGNAVQCTRLTSLTQQDGGIAITVLVTWSEKAAGSGFVPWVYDLRAWVSSPAAPAGG